MSTQDPQNNQANQGKIEEQKPKDLKEIVAEFAQKNRTLFCICLAFSIWLYHGMFDWSTNFGARVKSSSETLFVVQVFLTAFTLSRILVFINIIDIILRMPVVCDLIFWLSWEEWTKMSKFKLFASCFDFNTFDYIIQCSRYNFLETNKLCCEMMSAAIKLMVHEKMDRKIDISNFEKISAIGNVENILNIVFIDGKTRPCILRYATIQTKGFFYEEKWLPKIPKLDKCIKNKKYREAIGFTIALAVYAAPIALYFVYQWLFPTPIPIITPEQLFFSYVNKHFL
jgi:hypothetical protein